MPYVRHKSANERTSSARALVKALMGDLPGVSLKHKKECLSHVALYKVTEADCKYKFRTRFMSNAALEFAKTQEKIGSGGFLVHEHVTERSKIIDSLLKASPEEVDDILDSVVACIVTKEEHKSLNRFKNAHGWERYRAAEVRVWDTHTDSQYI
jgi:hypothetical protein